MLIAFWSNVSSSIGITTNLACIASFYAMRYNRQVILFENHMPRGDGLARALIPKKEEWFSVVKEEPYYYDVRGMEQLLKILRAGYEPETIDQIAISLLGGRLKYLPLSEQINAEIYEYELNHVIEKLLEELQKQADMVMVDTQKTGNLSTKVILDRADLVVVNVRQEPEQIDDFLMHYKGIQHKSVFLLSRYQDESLYNRVNLARMYDLDPDQIWAIPDYPLIPYLCEQGAVADFMLKHIWTSTGEKNYALIRELRRAAHLLHLAESEALSA